MGMEAEKVLSAASRARVEGEHRVLPVAAPQGFDQKHTVSSELLDLERLSRYSSIVASETPCKGDERAATSQALRKQG